MTATIIDRIAGAPASWGICEVPGWGHQLSPRRVLAEMRDAGLRATELGPDDFLPGSPQEQKALIESYGLAAVGAFCPFVLVEPTETLAPVLTATLDRLVAVGVGMMVIAAATGRTDYDSRPELDDEQWKTLLRNLEHAATMAADRGLEACLHPHVGTLVESASDVGRVLDGCDVPLCIDTGHLLVGGSDPVTLAHDVPERVAHVHLKDVNADVLATVRSGERTYTEGVRDGLYTQLGRGSVDLREVVGSLERSGYRGWYVFEQDRVLASEPDGDGPLADARACVQFLHSLEVSA